MQAYFAKVSTLQPVELTCGELFSCEKPTLYSVFVLNLVSQSNRLIFMHVICSYVDSAARDSAQDYSSRLAAAVSPTA